MGEAKLYGKSGGGMKIDGIKESYPVYAGETIKAGDFVEVIDGYARKATTKTFHGIAKTSGAEGSTIEVYVPIVAGSVMTLADGNVFTTANGDIFLLKEVI